ncbi:hypothetical protein ScPMuIL_017432 [Solemya velum]
MLRAEDVKEEFLLCIVCTREFDEDVHIPRVLPCLHTFCNFCVRKLVKNNFVACPLCKTKHDIPKDGTQGFAKDTTRRNLLDFLKVRKRASDILCKDCPDDSTASDFCRDCYIFMCSECTRAHRRSLASRRHSLMSIQQLQYSGLETFQRKLKCTRPGHEGQQMAFYCSKKTCEQLICTACTVCDHDKSRGHVVQNVHDIYQQKKAELKTMFKALDANVVNAKSLLQQTEQEMLNLDIKELEIEKDIDKAFEVCHSILEQRKADLKRKLASTTEGKKATLHKQIEKLEHYVDGSSNAQEFSSHIINYTDPTEFMPLFSTLHERLRSLTSHRITQNLQVESPDFEPRQMDADFQRVVKGMGRLSTSVCTRRIPISRGQTELTMSSARRPAGEADARFGEIFCPGFVFDIESVHQYREVSEDRRTLRNYATVQKDPASMNPRRLKKYRGVIGSRPFNQPGRYYYEVTVNHLIQKPLDNINFVFEIGISRRNEIDNGYYVYDQNYAWSFCGQHCEEHQKLCLWCRHNGRNLLHIPLSDNVSGTKVTMNYGFLLDTNHRKWTVIDPENDGVLYTFANLDVGRPLWPVFGSHWPSKVRLEMFLKTGREVESIPACVEGI